MLNFCQDLTICLVLTVVTFGSPVSSVTNMTIVSVTQLSTMSQSNRYASSVITIGKLHDGGLHEYWVKYRMVRCDVVSYYWL
jgi:hypothetical protein